MREGPSASRMIVVCSSVNGHISRPILLDLLAISSAT